MDRLYDMSMKVSALSEWIDSDRWNRERDPEALLWGRTVAKIAEENGELAQALIGLTGQNPRKGFTHELGDALKEALDVVITGLGAVEHMTGNVGTSMQLLATQLDYVYGRAGLGHAPIADAA